jgi:hypothetical protein
MSATVPIYKTTGIIGLVLVILAIISINKAYISPPSFEEQRKSDSEAMKVLLARAGSFVFSVGAIGSLYVTITDFQAHRKV